MATAVRRNRFVTDSVVVTAVVAGLLVGLATLCCCFEEHTSAHGAGRVAAAGLGVTPDALADGAVVGDPPDQNADGPGDGCGHRGDHPAAVVAQGGTTTRDLPVVVVAGIHRPDVGAARPVAVEGAPTARAPASHLLCIMRT